MLPLIHNIYNKQTVGANLKTIHHVIVLHLFKAAAVCGRIIDRSHAGERVLHLTSKTFNKHTLIPRLHHIFQHATLFPMCIYIIWVVVILRHFECFISSGKNEGDASIDHRCDIDGLRHL